MPNTACNSHKCASYGTCNTVLHAKPAASTALRCHPPNLFVLPRQPAPLGTSPRTSYSGRSRNLILCPSPPPPRSSGSPAPLRSSLPSTRASGTTCSRPALPRQPLRPSPPALASARARMPRPRPQPGSLHPRTLSGRWCRCRSAIPCTSDRSAPTMPASGYMEHPIPYSDANHVHFQCRRYGAVWAAQCHLPPPARHQRAYYRCVPPRPHTRPCVARLCAEDIALQAPAVGQAFHQ